MSVAQKTLAVFGGAFDPPHIGHQMVVLCVLDTQDIDELLVVPCFRHAFAKDLAPFEHRFAMCERAMRSLGPRVGVSDIERDLDDEKGRTLTMLQALQARRPDSSLRLVIGADILQEKSGWWRWGEIEKLAPPIVVARQGTEGFSPFLGEGTEDFSPFQGGVQGGEGLAMPDVSSTQIRRKLAAGESVKGLLSRQVIDYIDASSLYRSGGDFPVPVRQTGRDFPVPPRSAKPSPRANRAGLLCLDGNGLPDEPPRVKRRAACLSSALGRLAPRCARH